MREERRDCRLKKCMAVLHMEAYVIVHRPQTGNMMKKKKPIGLSQEWLISEQIVLMHGVYKLLYRSLFFKDAGSRNCYHMLSTVSNSTNEH